MFRRAVVVLVVAGVGFFAGARPANAVTYGPPPGPSHVGCDTVWMDPPSGLGLIQVTIHATIDGQSSTETVPYIGDDTHKAFFPKTRATLNVPGPHTFDFFWTWNLGPGESEHAKGTLTCSEIPTTTVSSTTIVSSTSTTMTSPTSIRKTSSTTACTEPRGCCLAQCAGAVELPHTGSSTLPAGLLGASLLGGGVALVLGARRRRTT